MDLSVEIGDFAGKMRLLDALDRGELPFETAELSPVPPPKLPKYSLLNEQGKTIAAADTKEALKLFFAPDYQIVETYGAE